MNIVWFQVHLLLKTVCIFAFKDTRNISQIIFENWPHRLTLNGFFLAQPFDRERGPDSQGT